MLQSEKSLTRPNVNVSPLLAPILCTWNWSCVCHCPPWHKQTHHEQHQELRVSPHLHQSLHCKHPPQFAEWDPQSRSTLNSSLCPLRQPLPKSWGTNILQPPGHNKNGCEARLLSAITTTESPWFQSKLGAMKTMIYYFLVLQRNGNSACIELEGEK